jgi:8-oxo-dGTP pyrophosphatase MutT (NUDIX family)
MYLTDLSELDIARLLAAARESTAPAEPGLEERFPPGFLNGEPKPAAVLVPFLRIGAAWHILFTRRTDHLPEHSGQVAFPGGRADPGDLSLEDTALRESQEEIGLDPSRVRILGRMSSFNTITNYLLTPVVGVIPWPFPIQVEKEEVSRVFTIPLDWLAEPSNHETRPRLLPPPYEPVQVIYFQPFDGEILWGVSAHIMLQLLRILKI